MKKSIKYLFFTVFPLGILNAQPDLSGTVIFLDSVGIDLIRVEVWQNNQQITNTITDSLGYFEIDSIITGLENSNSISPSSFKLYPNYPSPFDKKTNIIYEVNEPEEISITIYNSIGQKITTLTNGYRQKGFYVAQWNGRNNFGNEVAQGIYFARLDNGKDAKSIKLLKMNGALNAIGTSIPGGFYTSYKSSKVNEDYLVKFTDINIINRVDYTEITVSLPAQIHQVLTEAFSYTGPSQIVGDEGEQIAVANSWFNYGTQLDTIELMNTNIWSLINSTSDSLYFATIDTSLNGQIPLELKSSALHGTDDTIIIQTNLADIKYWQGQFVDDRKYKKLLRIVEPGARLRAEIRVGSQSFFTDNEGYFNIRIAPATNYTVKVQGIKENGDTTTYQHTFQLAGVDKTDLIFNAMPYWPLVQMGLTPQDGYDFAWEANFAPGPGVNVIGLKRIHLDTGEQWLARFHPNVGDTMTVEEQNYLASILEDSLNSRLQTPLSIYLATLQDTVPVSRRDGLNLWSVRRNGPFGSISVYDENLDGLLDFNDLRVMAGTPAWLPAILQEGASGIFGPWPVLNPNMQHKTIISEIDNPNYITPADKWLLRLIENYDNLENIDNILGGASSYSYMKNVMLLGSLMDQIELESGKKNPSRENFTRYQQEFISNIKIN